MKVTILLAKLGSTCRPSNKRLHELGRMLLFLELSNVGLGNLTSSDIRYSEFGKPYLPNGPEFNISHSQNRVACALSKGLIGIDIEAIKPINSDQFQDYLTQNELRQIKSSDDPITQFYNFWTKKEAVVKCTGIGLNAALNKLDVSNRSTTFCGGEYFFTKFIDDDGFVGHIASPFANVECILKFV